MSTLFLRHKIFGLFVLFFFSLAVISQSYAAAQATGKNIERISIGNAQNPPNPPKKTTTNDNGVTITKEEGTYPTGGSVIDAMRKKKKVILGGVNYNGTDVTGGTYTAAGAHLVNVVSVDDNQTTTTANGYTYKITNVVVYDPFYNTTISTTISEVISIPTNTDSAIIGTYIGLWNLWFRLEDQINIYEMKMTPRRPIVYEY